ncbi:S-type pyocin domain-containing protein [Pseudomonas xanthosomatis]|uniref:S-type pyocin domain-containing protein n=1 Tax=Pseudomonas xanthosomatis TaxID=2842356 RepID=UPI0035143ADD
MARKKRQVVLPPTFVGGQPTRPAGPAPGGTVINHVGPILENFRLSAYHAISTADGAARATYLEKLSMLASLLEEEVAALRMVLANTPRSHIEMLMDDIAARSDLLQRKIADLSVQQALANSYYGSTPFDKSAEYYAGATFHNISTGRFNVSAIQEALNASYRGAYTALLREAEIQMLQAQVAALQQALEDAQALNERAPQPPGVGDRYDMALQAGAAPPALLITALGAIGVVGANTPLAQAVNAGIEAVRNARAGVLATPFAVGVAALLYPSELGNGELPDNYLLSMALADLGLELDNAQQAAAIAQGAVDLPLRMGSHGENAGRDELFVAGTDGPELSSRVGVLAAHFDAATGQYSVSTEDSPPRTLVWTPAVTPPSSSTTSPVSPQPPIVLVGPTMDPLEGRLDAFPELADTGFDDYVIIFPADSGLPPLYVMFKSRRYMPGEVEGLGGSASGNLLVEGNQQGAAIPAQIAREMQGKGFSSFGRFRSAFWMLIAATPDFSGQFDDRALALMRNGYAPIAPDSEQVGARVKYEIHHKQRIADGGAVYDVDNMVILSPKFHVQMHRGD